MSESAESVDLIKLPVSKLTLGMFVTAIDRNDQGRLAIANAGQIKHKDSILKLSKSGIKYVWVDTERSAEHCGFKRKASNDSLSEVKKSLLTREKQQAQAKVILTEAKDLIRKVLSETFEGKAIEVAPFEALADSMIESVLLDEDALKCMSALRTKDAYLLEQARLRSTIKSCINRASSRLKNSSI